MARSACKPARTPGSAPRCGSAVLAALPLPALPLAALMLAPLVLAGCGSTAGAARVPSHRVATASTAKPSARPAVVDDDHWRDRRGAVLPAGRVHTMQGPQHCDDQDITFTFVGSGAPSRLKVYVRDTTGKLRQSLLGSFDATAKLPTRAVDTGWHRAGRELWLVPRHDAAYLVRLDRPTSVERWPAARPGFGCA